MVPVTDPSKSQTCLEWALDKMSLNGGEAGSAGMQAQMLTFMKMFRQLECSSCSGLVAFQHRVTGTVFCVKTSPEDHDHCYERMMEASHFKMPMTNMKSIPEMANALHSLSLEKKGMVEVNIGRTSLEKLLKNEGEVTPKLVAPQQSLVDVVDCAPVRVAPMPKPSLTEVKLPKVRATGTLTKEVPQGVKVYLFTACNYSSGLVDGANVTVSFTWNATKFSVTAASDAGPIDSLQDVLAEYALTAKPLTAPPKVGEIVVAKYGYDGYFRGKVAQVSGENCKIMFVDFGDAADDCKYSELLPVNEKIMEHPIYGLIVHLEKLPMNPKDVKLTEELEKIVLENENGFKLQLCHKGKITPSEDPVEVRLLYGDGLSLNETIQNALWPGAAVATPKLVTPQQEVKLPKVRATASLMKEVPQGVKVYLFAACNYSSGLVDGADVEVSFTWNATKFSVTAVSDAKQLDSLQDMLAEYALTAKPLTAPPKVGEIVVAKYGYDGYFRGKVAQVSGENCKIMFVDFGDAADDCKYSELLPVNEKIMEHPIYGLIVHLEKLPMDPKVVKLTTQELEKIVLENENGFKLQLCHKGKITPSEDPVEVRLLYGNGLSLNETIQNALWPGAAVAGK